MSESVLSKSYNTKSYNIVISYHSNFYDGTVELIYQQIRADDGLSPVLISESNPSALSVREQYVRWADIVLVLYCYDYQQSPTCVEFVNYAKDCKKKVVSVNLEPHFTPTGAVGAICRSWGREVEYTERIEELHRKVLEIIKEELVHVVHSDVEKPIPNINAEPDVSLETIPSSSYVFITFTEDGRNVALLLQSGQGVSNQGASANSLSNLPVKLGRPNQSNVEMVKNCKVFVPVMTASFQESRQCKEDYECARKYGKYIIPVKGEKFRPAGWLSLAIAGKLYYELIESSQAYLRHKNVSDSTPMNDFIYAVMVAWEGKQTPEDREKALITSLTTQIDDIKPKLTTWPPKERSVLTKPSKIPSPAELLSRDVSKLPLNHITYTATRMSFTPPKPLFDKHGIAIQQKFDVMLSYQWDNQDFVRSFYMDFTMKTFSTWMDVWGGMQGNINEAMATAVENSAVIISFLTEKYQKSVNCNLELKYAKLLGKPIVFIKVERDMEMKNWIQEIVHDSVCIEMSSVGDFGIMENGVPKINRLAEAVRNLLKWCAVQPKQMRRDVSGKVYRLQNQLEDALFALAEQENRKRFEQCTRCGAQFEADSPSGCKIHRAYYMGGTIISGRWVCCSQREKNSMGCENASHTVLPRKWKEMSHKGCYQWNPK